MSSKFSLLKHLERSEEEKGPLLPKGIKYREYIVETNEGEVTVYIPLRECQAFESKLIDSAKYVDKEDLRSLLRKHRGIKA